MPHDKNGLALGDGDLVSVQARVRVVSTGELYCNVTVETVEPMWPGDSKTTVTLNARQVELVEKAAPVLEPPAVAGQAAADQEQDAGGE